MASQKFRVSDVCKTADKLTGAEKLTGEQHPEAQVITGKKAKLLEAWARLESLAMSRQQRLLGAHEIQRFNRDADETIVWITEKELWPDLLKATEK